MVTYASTAVDYQGISPSGENMQTVNIHDAKRCLSKLVGAAANSDEITVTKTGKPVGTIHDQRMIAPRVGSRLSATERETSIGQFPTVSRH